MGFYNVLNRILMQSGQPEDISQIVANLDAIATILNGQIDPINLRGSPGLVANEFPLYDGANFGRKALGSVAAGWGTLLGVRVLTASGNYVPTAGTTRVYVECVGGGGQGGGVGATGVGQFATGSGGGGGAYAASLLTAGFSGTAFVIGAGGSTSAAGNNNGQAGADTVFGANVIVAKGGSGGQGAPASGGTNLFLTNITSGGLASACVGDIRSSGGAGEGSFGLGAGAFRAGSGGNTILGIGGVAVINATAGGNGGHVPTIGGGGSGAGATASSAAQQGGAGAGGLIRIWEFSG